MKIDDFVKKMAEDVHQFQKEKLDLPYHNGMLPPHRMKFRLKHLDEELGEIAAADQAKQPHDVVDGLIDLIYIAIGTLLEMGVHPEGPWDIVHTANMKKQRGMTKRGEAFDAVKPEGWEPPDHRPLLEHFDILRQVSPIFIAATRMRISKGKNYNRGTVKRRDHFPFGDFSYMSMVWIKTIRMRSLVESLFHITSEEEIIETRRLIDRELGDLINYSCYWAESIRGLDTEA